MNATVSTFIQAIKTSCLSERAENIWPLGNYYELTGDIHCLEHLQKKPHFILKC